MTGFSPRAIKSFEVARAVFELLAARKIDTAVIGSVALAVHGYIRATRDIDLGVAVLAFASLQRLADPLRERGYDVDVGEPSPDDPVGGVLTVSGADFDPIQVVNLRAPSGRHEKLAREAIAKAEHVPELELPVVGIPHLVALKLVAGSRKDELDVIELLRANPDAPLDQILAVCGRHRLKGRLDKVLAHPS